MSSVALTGNDTIIINGRILNDLADADAATLDFPNDKAAAKVGKNGNVVYAYNATGKLCNVTLRIVRGSDDDKYLNALMIQQDANFAGTVLNDGEFIKKIGNGQGKVLKDIYIMSGGLFTKGVNAKSNSEGDTEQSVSVYSLVFANAPRALT